LSETEIIDHALRRIQERFAADYLCMYLTNDEGIIDRRILNDPRIKSEPESVNIQQNSVLLQAIRKAGPTTIQNNSSYQNHLSDRAKTAILFPMRTDEQTIGILDIQFINNPLGSIVDQNTIQAIATRLADTLSKSRYLTQIREHLNEQEITAKRLEAQLLTIQTQRKDTIDTFWGDYVEQRGIHAFGFDIRNQRIIPANEVSDSMKVALENKDIYIATEADGKTLNVPIQVRDRVLGALAFTVSMDQNLTERQIETVQTIANRLGTALENVRLLEQTQAQAIRERKAGESANVLIGATDINSLIQIAADNFNDTLGAIQTRIYLEPNVNSPSRSEHPRGLNGNQLSNGTKSETGA
jgi:GAF domain-containing protein